MSELHACDRCGVTYDEAKGDGYCGLCPSCADATDQPSECAHRTYEDCMNCNICGACNEDLDECDACTGCVQLEIDEVQAGIDSGQVWLMEGAAGRLAMQYIKSGLCTLGEEGHNDYYGNWVPSRTEVKPGTKGSPEYAERMREEAEEA